MLVDYSLAMLAAVFVMASPIDVTRAILIWMFNVVQFQKPWDMKVTNTHSSFPQVLIKIAVYVITNTSFPTLGGYLYALLVISPWILNVQHFRL
jgi:hypothetical protein